MQVYALSHAISINRRHFYYNVEKLFGLLTFVDYLMENSASFQFIVDSPWTIVNTIINKKPKNFVLGLFIMLWSIDYGL